MRTLKKPKTPKLGKASTLARAAALMGEPFTVELLKSAKEAGLPGFDDHNRVDCDVLREALENPEVQESLKEKAKTNKSAAEIKRIELQCARLAFNLEKDKKLVISRAKVQEDILSIGKELATMLTQRENDLPAKIEGQTALEIRLKLKANHDSIFQRWQEFAKPWMDAK